MVSTQQKYMEEFTKRIETGGGYGKGGKNGKDSYSYADDSGDYYNGYTNRPPRPIDSKSLDKPTKYDGDVRKFIHWSMKLKDYLSARDERWRDVLREIEKFGYQTMTPEDESDMAIRAGITEYIGEFRSQLYTYLTNYTTGAPAISLSAAGTKGAFETYRRLADAGRSRRPDHLLKLNCEVLQPGQVSDYKHLETAIATWEHNIAYFHDVAPTSSHLSEDQRRLILISMTPKDLKEHLTKETGKFEGYDRIRAEIFEWVHRVMAPKAASCWPIRICF